MKVLLPEKGLVGPCLGVIRGLQIIKTAIRDLGNSGGYVVYQDRYMTASSLRYARMLENAGLPVRSMDSAVYGTDDIISISPYGAPPSVYIEMLGEHRKFIDLTCPTVTSFYMQVAEKARRCHQVLIVGNKDDYESNTALAYSRGRARVISSCADLKGLNWWNYIVVVRQTTFPEDLFVEIVDEVKKKAKKKLTVVDTGCPVCKVRVDMAVSLAKVCKTLLIVGEGDSSYCSYVERLLSDSCCHLIRLGPDGEIPGNQTISAWQEPIGIVSSVSVTEAVIEQLKSTLEGI